MAVNRDTIPFIKTFGDYLVVRLIKGYDDSNLASEIGISFVFARMAGCTYITDFHLATAIAPVLFRALTRAVAEIERIIDAQLVIYVYSVLLLSESKSSRIENLRSACASLISMDEKTALMHAIFLKEGLIFWDM